MNPTKFTWTPPTTNVDGSAFDPSEVTGYELGIRPASGTAGTYPTLVEIAGEATAVEEISAIVPPLAPGDYAAAIRAVGPVDSAFTSEVSFTIAPPTPAAPSDFTVG
jgi:hypothetical protein